MGIARMSDEQIQKRSDLYFNGRYKFLGRSRSDAGYGTFECLEHGHPFMQLLSSHFEGRLPRSCPGCKELSMRGFVTVKRPIFYGSSHPEALSDEELKRRCEKKFGHALTFIGRDPDNFTRGIFMCRHGKELASVASTTVGRGGGFPQGCEKCSKERYRGIKLGDEEIRERSFRLFEGKIYFKERDTADSRLGYFICWEHGIHFRQPLASHFLGQKGCKLCREPESKLSKLIFRTLCAFFPPEEIEREKTFGGLRYKYPLRYDYFIPKINLLIEADGRQHFEAVAIYGGNPAFEIRYENDLSKNKFARDNGISLKRIPHWRLDETESLLSAAIEKVSAGETLHDTEGFI